MMLRRIRILHVLDNLGRGGLQNGLVNLISCLPSANYEHVVCTTRPLEHKNAYRFSDMHVRVLTTGSGDRIKIPALARVIREVAPHIVHSRNWGAIEAVIAAWWVRSCAVVHSEHGIDSQFSVREPLRRTGFRRAAFELADQVICVSNQLRSYHASRTGFSQQRITVIHNGVDVERFAADPERRAAARRDLGLSENNFCIGCIGNLTPVKDYMTLFRAMARVAHGCADWRVIIVGDGPLRDQLENFVRESALRDQVSFHGLTERVSDFLNAFDVYALTSVSEGISNSLLESMATGLPVVVTATGGNPEVVADKESGLLFPVGDFEKLAEHLLLLKARPDLRLDFGRQARRRVNEEFSIDSMIQRYHCLYTSLAPLNRVVNHRGIEAN